MKHLLWLLILASAIPAEAQLVENPFERVYSNLGVGQDLGVDALWWTFESSVNRWRLVYDLDKQELSRFDLGINLGRKPDINAHWWLGFSFALPHSDRPAGLAPKYLPGEGGQGFLFGQFRTASCWAEGRYPLAEISDGVSWPWSVDLRELSVGRTRCFGGELSGLVKAGYHSDTGGYAGAGVQLRRGKLRLSYDTHDGPSAEARTEITGW